jgi:hypothetical protein
VTQRLLYTAKARWAAFDGWAATTMAGLDPLDLPLDRFLNLIYYWLVREAHEDEVAKFDTRLWRPPKGVKPAPGSPWSAERESAAFAGFASQVRGGPPPRG